MGQGFAKFWHGMWSDASRDLCSIGWKRGLSIAGLFLWTAGLIVLAFVLGLVTRFTSTLSSACTPDGAFSLEPASYSYWGGAGFFQITLAYGELSFGQAKFIDIAWDVAFGRGGQAILALASWRVFAYYMTTSMEVAPITYRSFQIVFLQSGPSIFSILRLIRDFAIRHGLHSKLAMIFMVASMIFTLAFPTLASAMTGYVGHVQAFVPDKQNHNFIRFATFRPVLYVIHDGERINQTSGYLVTDAFDGSESDDPVILHVEARPSWRDFRSRCGYRRWLDTDSDDPTSWNETIVNEGDGACAMQNSVSNYVKQHGFFGGKNASSTFTNFTLDSPVLNISAFYMYDPTLFGTGHAEFEERLDMTWTWSNETYDYEYVSKQGSCQATGYYQWGFSFIQLFVMVILLLIWTIGVLLMWARARAIMRDRGRDTVSGEYKAIVDLAATMQKEIGSKFLDIHRLTEEEVKQRIHATEGGHISYHSPNLMELRPHFRPWLRREKWWLLATCIFVVAVFTIWPWAFWPDIFLIGPTLGLLFSLAFGSTSRSRAVFIYFFTMLSLIPVLVVILVGGWHVANSSFYCYTNWLTYSCYRG